MKYLITDNVYIDLGGTSLKYLYHGLSTCTADNQLAKARGSSLHTGGQTIASVHHHYNINCCVSLMLHCAS